MERKFRVGLILLLGVGFLVLFLIAVPVPNTIYEKCPQVTVKNVPLSYHLVNNGINTGSKGLFFPEYWYSPYAKVSNDDIVGGVFTLEFQIYKSDGATISEMQKKYIAPGAIETVTVGPYKFNIAQASVSVTPPTKEQLVTESKMCSNTVYRPIIRL